MKKILIVLIIGCLSGSALAGRSYAQAHRDLFAYTDAKAFAPSIMGVAIWQDLFSYDSASTLESKYINFKANKDFKERYSGATETKWYAIKDGYLSYFKLDGFSNRVFYNRKGEWQASLIILDEAGLPKDIRATVKSVYYDYQIRFVEDVETVEGGVYMIHVENNSLIKILRVTKDGQMETLQEIQKA